MNRAPDYQTSDFDAETQRPAATTPPDDSDQEVRDIQRGIEETRAEMSETIDALQHRLNPAYLKEQVKEQVIEQVRQVKDSVRQATLGKVEDMVDRVSDSGRSIGETIRANPIPSALVGIGLAWLWMNRRGDSAATTRRYDRSYGYDRYGEDRGYDPTRGAYDDRRSDYSGGRTSAERYGAGYPDAGSETASAARRAGNAVSNAANQVQRTASDLAGRASNAISGAVDQAQQKAGYIAERAQQKAGYVAERAQYQARRVEETFNQQLNDNPVALGAIALALGTAVGLALPQTRKENELMGSARDSLMDKAQAVAHDAIDQVNQVAQQVTNRDTQAGGAGAPLGGPVNTSTSTGAVNTSGGA